MRTAAFLALSAISIFCIWAGTSLAPAMTWPKTATEFHAANFLVLGMVAKTAAYAFALRR